jgi:hypothetical protein
MRYPNRHTWLLTALALSGVGEMVVGSNAAVIVNDA